MRVVGILEQLLLHFTFFVIPFQVGKHFWPEFSFIEGMRSDYLSPTLHVSDVSIILLFICFIIRMAFSRSTTVHVASKASLLIPLFFIMVGISTIEAHNSPAAVYGMIKMVEFVFLGMYIASTKFFKISLLGWTLFFGIIFSTILSIFQFMLQGSIGGFLYFLGERTFTGETPGIANASLGGRLVLRPYATFPHPNVLGGYLTIAALLLGYCFSRSIKKTIVHVGIGIATIGIVLSMSRLVWVLWLLTCIILYIPKRPSIRQFFLGAGGFVALGFLFFLSPFAKRITDISLSDESIVQRLELLINSWTILSSHVLHGVGLKNFLIHNTLFSPLLHQQPVHNIYVLLLTEIGITAFLFIIYFLVGSYFRFYSTSLFNRRYLGCALGFLVVVGVFDHYLITLQQGNLLLALVFGLLWRKNKDTSDTIGI